MYRVTMLATLVAFAGSGTANAQDSAVRVGVTAGAVIATLVGDDTDGSDARTSPYFGGSLVLHRQGTLLGFETGLLYVPKGATEEFDGGEGTLKITYLEVPLLARLALNLQGSAIRPIILLGGSLGIKSGCKVEATSGNVSAEADCDDSTFEGTLDLKSIDFGVAGGVGVDIPVGSRGTLSPTVRYTRGLSDIGDTSDNADAKNSAFQIGVSFMFSM